jgi:hypothetical protein
MGQQRKDGDINWGRNKLLSLITDEEEEEEGEGGGGGEEEEEEENGGLWEVEEV